MIPRSADDDGIEWVTYPGGFVSAVEIEATEGYMLGIVVDAFSYSTTAGAYTLTITEGNCPGPGATCALDDGTDGVYDCDGVCVADTRGDGTCDAALECGDLGWDGDDCTVPAVGDACDHDYLDWFGLGDTAGVRGCDLTCVPEYYLGRLGNDYCDRILDCEEFEFDGGDCLDTLDACTLEDGFDGIYDCDMVCSPDTLGDGTCDATFDCYAASYDSEDCEAPGPGEACAHPWGPDYSGIMDCSGTCSFLSYLGDGERCDSFFDCEELCYDKGDCIDSGDAISEMDGGMADCSRSPCVLEDGTAGIYDCDGVCSPDTRGDGTCDWGMFCCWSFDYDDGDCADPAPGDPCHCVTDPLAGPCASPGRGPHRLCRRVYGLPRALRRRLVLRSL